MRTDKIQQRVDKICEGNFCDADIGLLFVWLRPKLKEDPVLWDVANFVAHNDERDQGISFEYVQKLITEFLTAFENGGEVRVGGSVFKSDDLINRLMSVLRKLKIQFDDEKIINQKVMIIDSLQGLINGVSFLLKDEPRVVRCYVEKSGSKMNFHAELSSLVTRCKSMTFSLFD